jgi:hypothetical protein
MKNHRVMKTKKTLFLLVLLAGLTNCQKDDNLNANHKIIFCNAENPREIIANYNDIIGYDSTKYIFRVDESVWEKIRNQATYDPPYFKLGVVCDNQMIYKATYIPGYVSTGYYNIITFMPGVPDLIYMILGYPGSTAEYFSGEDLRNDSRLINQFKKDNKLIDIKE